MKGVIVLCLKEMVQKRFGEDKWETALKKAGIEKEPTIMPRSDVDDQIVLNVINSVCEVLHISLDQAADAFGDYWINTYAQRMYGVYFTVAKTAKDFLLKMDSTHVTATKNIPGAHPPRFDYEQPDEKTLIMTYKSSRGLIDIMIGLVKGVGKFYHEDLKITKLEGNRVKIVFP